MTHVLRLNLALSAAALTALEREGLLPLIDRIADLAADGASICSQRRHGAVLPLLLRDEVLRQLDLTHTINQRIFGDSWHPSTLWPSALAFSYKVAELAQERDFSSILVDEAAMRTPGHWPGDRIDCIDKMPGMFLLPCSRAATHALAKGEIATDAELLKFVKGGVEANRYIITAWSRVAIDASSALRDRHRPQHAHRAGIQCLPSRQGHIAAPVLGGIDAGRAFRRCAVRAVVRPGQ